MSYYLSESGKVCKAGSFIGVQIDHTTCVRVANGIASRTSWQLIAELLDSGVSITGIDKVNKCSKVECSNGDTLFLPNEDVIYLLS